MIKKRGMIIVFFIAITFAGFTQPASIDLIQDSRTAQWFNDRGVRLPFPGRDNDARGFARLLTAALEDGQTYSNVLETHPRWESRGGIEGRFSLHLPENASFQATVGFLRGASASDGVQFEALWKAGNKETILASAKKPYNRRLASLSADLSPYGGQSGILILRVRAGASSGQDWAVWKQVVITAAGAPSPGKPADIGVTKPVPGKPARKPAPVEPARIPSEDQAAKIPHPLPSIPIDRIREANGRIQRYQFEMESVNPGLKYNGIVDESRELLYLRISPLDDASLTAKALVEPQTLRPADFYRISDKGYGRPLGNPSWVRVRIKEPFPHYLQEATEFLAWGKIISVGEEGELWKIAVGSEEILSKLNAAEFSLAVLGEPKTPQQRDRLGRMMSSLAGIQAASQMWVSRRDHLIKKLTIEIRSARGASRTDISFRPVRTPPPPLPQKALEAGGPEIPISTLLFRIPEDTGIGGWSDIMHCSLALRALQLVRDTDEVTGRRSYFEIYNMKPVARTGDAGACPSTLKDGELKIVKPTEDSHPVLIGTYYEDQKNRPGWKYSSGAEEYIKEKLENPLEDVPICRKDEDACDPAKQFYDRWLSPENAEEYCPNCYSRPYHHYGTAEKGVPDKWYYALWPPVPSKIFSARDRGYGGGRGSDGKNPTRMTFIDGIDQYNKYTDQGKKNAYLMIGHVMHLLQDQSEPDHARLVPHPASGKSEPAWFDEIYVCEIRSAEAGLAAFGFCPPGFKLICFAIAAAVGLRDCKDSIDKDDVGFEWLVDNHWVMSEREELASQIEARGVQRQPNYDSFFQALGEYVNQKVEELGFESDFADGNSLGCGTLLIPPEIPAGDPDIDKTSEEEKNRYLELADHVASGAVCLGAGFLEYFYEVVNHPPYVQRVVVTTGGRGIPRLLDRGEGREAEIIYDAHWEDIVDRETKTTVERRVFRKMTDRPFNPRHEAFLYIELGPQLEPEKGKVASRIEVSIGSFSTAPSLRRAEDGTPVYMAVIPAGALAMNCGEGEIVFPIEIRAWDRSAHLGTRSSTGEEIDADPISVATVETSSGSFELENYQPGTDRSHVLRLAPITWETAVSTTPGPIPPAGTPPWALPAIRIAAPSSGTKTDAIYLKAFSPETTGSPSVIVYVPTACAVQWTAGSVAGPSGEGSSDDLYHFHLNIPNPGSAVAKLEVNTNPTTTRGAFTIMINYMVGTIRRTLGIPIQIY